MCPLAASHACADGAIPLPIVYLHGRDVVAVNAIFNGAVERHDIDDSVADLSRTTVFVTDSDSTVAVSIVQNERRHTYSFEPADGSSRVDSTPSRGEAMSLSGSATKALVAAYSSWLQGAIAKIAGESDIRSGAFETEIVQSRSGRTGAAGFIVSYVPIPTRHVGLTNCNVFRNTFVFFGTWKTILEPFIC